MVTGEAVTWADAFDPAEVRRLRRKVGAARRALRAARRMDDSSGVPARRPQFMHSVEAGRTSIARGGQDSLT